MAKYDAIEEKQKLWKFLIKEGVIANYKEQEYFPIEAAIKFCVDFAEKEGIDWKNTTFPDIRDIWGKTMLVGTLHLLSGREYSWVVDLYGTPCVNIPEEELGVILRERQNT